MSAEADIHSLEADFAKRPNSDAFIGLCQAYLGQKRYMEAMLVCKKGIKNLPADPRGRLLLARVYLEQGKPPKAEQELQQLLSLFPDNLDALIMQADVFKSSGRKTEAIALLQRVMQSQPGRDDVKEALKALGVDTSAPPPPPPRAAPPPVPQASNFFSNDASPHADSGPPSFEHPGFASGGNPVLAEEPMSMPMRRPTTNTFVPLKKQGSAKGTLYVVLIAVFGFGGWIAYYINHVTQVRRIDALMREAKPQIERDTYVSIREALQIFQKVLEIDDKSPQANAAIAYFDYWLYGEQLVLDAKEPADKALAVANQGSEKDETAYHIAASGQQKLYAGDAAGTLAEIEPKVKAGASATVISLVLADAYLAQGKENEAQEELKRAAHFSAADNQVLVRMGESSLDEGKYEGAKGYFDQVLNQESGHPGALLGRILANVGRKQEAIDAADKDLEKFASIPPDYLTPRWQAGLAWCKGLLDVRHGRGQDAAKNFADADKIPGAKGNPRWLAVRAKAYLSSGAVQPAVDDFKAVLARRPNFRPAQLGLVLAYSSMNKPAEAMTFVDQLLAKDPNDTEILVVRAAALRNQGKLDDSIAAYQKILAVNKTNFEAKIALAQVYGQKRDFAKAQELLSGMIKTSEVKGRTLSITSVELAHSYLEQGDAERAKGLLTDVAAKDPQFPDTYFFFAKLLKGKPQKEALQHYLQMAPGGTYAPEAERMLKTGK